MYNAHNEYQKNQIETAEPRQLVVMLYEGALKFLERAVLGISDFRKYDEVNTNLLKAQDIITELMLSLDMQKGGEIADNLMNIYAYMKKELLDSNIKKEKNGIEQVMKMLVELKSAWVEMDTVKTVPAKDEEPQKMKARGGFVAQG